MVSRVRLMTANLLHSMSSPSSLAAVLDLLAPDVLLIQELGPQSVDVIEKRFPHHHLVPAEDFTGRGVASRLPGELGDLPLPSRSGVQALVETGFGPLGVAGVHLVNPITFPWWRQARIRAGQARAVREWAAARGPGPLVVAGDFNATPAMPAYRRLAEGLIDLAEAAGTPEPTWGWRPGWPRVLRIDHVLGRGVEAIASRSVAIEGSDHAAVVVDLAGA